MAKKVFMIAPFEALTGNLSGDQELQYAENNNPAYEAPNGTQYARNYRTRYIGARRGKDGLVYFQVKQTSATVLKSTSRRTMAIIGVTAAIKSALMKHQASVWSEINRAFNYVKSQGLLPEGQETFNKWFSAQVKSMLVYRQATWSFTQATISFTVHNPYDLMSSQALPIKQSTWVKFADLFAFDTDGAVKSAYVTIDGMMLFCAASSDDANVNFSNAKNYTQNPCYVANLVKVAVTAENVTYNSLPVYTMEGSALSPEAVIATGDKFTTAVESA